MKLFAALVFSLSLAACGDDLSTTPKIDASATPKVEASIPVETSVPKIEASIPVEASAPYQDVATKVQ